MRRLLWLLTLGALAVALTACPRKAEEEAATETAPAEETSLPGANVRVGLAFDAGGKFDRSFNQSAWEGAQRAAQELGVQIFDFEPADPSQVGQGIRTFPPSATGPRVPELTEVKQVRKGMVILDYRFGT